MNLVIRKLGTHHFRIWVIYSIHACFGQGFLNVMSYLKIRLNSGMNRNSDRVSGSGLPNPELSKTPFRFRLNRSRILNVSGIRPDIPVPSRAQARHPPAPPLVTPMSVGPQRVLWKCYAIVSVSMLLLLLQYIILEHFVIIFCIFSCDSSSKSRNVSLSVGRSFCLYVCQQRFLQKCYAVSSV